MDYEDEEDRLRVRRGVERVQLDGSGEELGRIVTPPVQVLGEQPDDDPERRPT